MKYFLRYLKPHVLTMCFGFFIKFSGTIMDLLIPYILSYIIDEVTPKNDIGLVVRWGLLMILCAALVLLTNVWANRIASAVSRDVIHALRYDLFYRISYLSGSQVDFFTIPSLVTRMTSDTYNLHRMLNMIQRMGVRAPILFLGGIDLMGGFPHSLLNLGLGAAICLGALPLALRRHKLAQRRKMQE